MSDDFMYSGHRAPSAELVRRVRATLHRADSEIGAVEAPRRGMRAAASVAALLVVAGAFAFPSVRAGARAFLDLFRVVNFAPIAIDESRIQQLADGRLDLPQLMSDQVEVLKAAGPPQEVATVEAAGAAAGLHVQLPAWRPVGWQQAGVWLRGENQIRVTASTQKLRHMLDTLGIDDLSVPDELNGKQATIRVSPVVRVAYRRIDAAEETAQTVWLQQSRQPEVSFPAGLDLAMLAEIGLRVLGIERAEAHRFAQNIDWRTTLIVPVPAQAASFRQVDVQGHPGLLIEMARAGGVRNRVNPSVVMWSSGDSVFALEGALRPAELFEMAQSVQ